MFARKSTIPEVHPGRPMICFGPGFLPARSCPGEVHSSIVPALQSTICFLNPSDLCHVLAWIIPTDGRPWKSNFQNRCGKKTSTTKNRFQQNNGCCSCRVFVCVLDFLCLASRDFFHIVQIISFFSLFSSLAFAKHRKKGLAKSPAAENILSCGRGLFVAPGFPPTKSGQVTLVLSSSPAQFLRGFSSSPR